MQKNFLDTENNNTVNSSHPLEPFLTTCNSKGSINSENNGGKKKENGKRKTKRACITEL